MEDLFNDVAAERLKYGPTMTVDQCVELLNAVAWKNRANGWGLSSKPNGSHGTRSDGVPCAADILYHGPSNSLVDCLIESGSDSRPAWQELGVNNDLTRPFVAPIQPAGEVVVDPPPPPPPVASGLTQENLDAAVAAIVAQVNAHTDQKVDHLEDVIHSVVKDAEKSAADLLAQLLPLLTARSVRSPKKS